MSWPLNLRGTLNQKDLPYVDVRRFGVRLDGSDSTAALTDAVASGERLWLPRGVCCVSTVVAANLAIAGDGVLRKVPGTKGPLLELTGDSNISGLTLDYDQANADRSGTTATFGHNNLVRQVGGSLMANGIHFRRSLITAVTAHGASLFIGGGCRFTESALHNELIGTAAMAPHYISATADASTTDQVVFVSGCTFEGGTKNLSQMHLNPTGIIIDSFGTDGPRYRTVSIVGNVFHYCGMNAGVNVTGAIDVYNGADHVNVSSNNIRFFSYTGIKIQNSSRVVVSGNLVTDGQDPVGSGAPGRSLGISVSEKARTSTADQSSANIIGNIVRKAAYVGIYNSLDDANIIGNVIDGVDLKASQGTGIENTGSNVNISKNIVRDVEGYLLKTTGNNVDIEGNVLSQRRGSSQIGILFSGNAIKLRDNKLLGAVGATWVGSASVIVGDKIYWSGRAYLVTTAGQLSPDTGPSHSTGTSSNGTAELLYIAPSALRTDGPASQVSASGNYLTDFSFGLDVRTGAGAVTGLMVGESQVGTIVTAPENIASSVASVSKQARVVLNVGNANATAPRGAATVFYTAPITGERTVAPFTGPAAGSSIRVVRQAASTGAFNVVTPSGAQLSPGQWAEDVWSGSAWVLAARATLS